MTDSIRAALERLQEYASAHPEHDTDRLLAAALAAAPPAPDPNEALAARPLLEAVARMGDRIGQHTVSEITVISDRAAHWLAQNPPGQPVAIEPRGCPTPGACSCVEPPAPAPVVEEDDGDDAIDRWIDSRPGWPNDWPAVTQCQLTALIGEALEHWGRPATPPAPAGNHIPDATEMVGDSEREELAAALIADAECLEADQPECMLLDSRQHRRAAALLRQPAPAPVPVSERPWEREEWCDAEGRCWWGRCADEFFSPEWTLATHADIEEFCSDAMPQISLPHWALPSPPQGGEVAK